MKIVKTILQGLLIAQFSFFGSAKILGMSDMVQTFTNFGFASWFMVFTGVVELSAVFLLLYGFINQRTVYAGAFLIAGLTICASLCHFFLEGNIGNGIIPLVVLAQTLLMVRLHNRKASTKPAATLAVA